MDKDNQYYGIIENLVRNHRKFDGYEEILDNIISDVYSHSENVISTIDNQDVIIAYLQKVVATSIITVPKRLNFKSKNSIETITAASILEKSRAQHEQKEEIVPEMQTEDVSPSVETTANEENLVFEENNSEELLQEDSAFEESTSNDTDSEEVQKETIKEMFEEEPPAKDEIKVNTTLVDNMINSAETHNFELQPETDRDNEDLFVALENDAISVEEDEETEDETEPAYGNIELGIEPEETMTLEVDNEEVGQELGEAEEETSHIDIGENSEETVALEFNDSSKEEEFQISAPEEVEELNINSGSSDIAFESSENTQEIVEDIEEQTDFENIELSVADENEVSIDFGNNEEVFQQESLEMDDSVDEIGLAEEDITIDDSYGESLNEETEESIEEQADFENIELSIADENEISIDFGNNEEGFQQESLEMDDSVGEISLAEEDITVDDSYGESLNEETEQIELSEDDNSGEITIDFGTGDEVPFEGTIPLISDEVEIDSFSDNYNTELAEIGDNTNIDLSLQEDNGMLLSESDEFSQPLEEDDESIDLSDIGQKGESSVFNYSIFDCEPSSVEIQSANVLYALENLARENPELNILQIYNLKYNQKMTISEISSFLKIEQSDVAKALSQMAAIV